MWPLDQPEPQKSELWKYDPAIYWKKTCIIHMQVHRPWICFEIN